MLALIRKTHREFGISVVLSSHLMGDVERTCERILVLENGRVLEEGETSTFIEVSETLYIEVTARRPELLAALAERDVTATEEGSSLIVDAVSGEVYDRIRDALVAADAPLRRLAPRRRTLSELFQPGGVHEEDGA
jgi:ABC-2 type transport system ATP-binding protein